MTDYQIVTENNAVISSMQGVENKIYTFSSVDNDDYRDYKYHYIWIIYNGRHNRNNAQD